MITEHDLQEAIAECEGQRNPSSNTCLKLAAFYTIKDKMYPAKQKEEVSVRSPRYSMSMALVNSDSEFVQLVKGLRPEEYLPVMNELMETLQAIMPRLYDGVMRKLTVL